MQGRTRFLAAEGSPFRTCLGFGLKARARVAEAKIGPRSRFVAPTGRGRGQFAAQRSRSQPKLRNPSRFLGQEGSDRSAPDAQMNPRPTIQTPAQGHTARADDSSVIGRTAARGAWIAVCPDAPALLAPGPSPRYTLTVYTHLAPFGSAQCAMLHGLMRVQLY